MAKGASMSMSPPGSSEAPTPAKRGRGAGGTGAGRGGGGRKKAAAGEGGTPKAPRGRKKRQSTVDTPSAAPTPLAGSSAVHTPGAGSSHPSPGLNFASILEDANNSSGLQSAREGSQFSASRQSTSAAAKRARETGTATGTQAGEGYDDDEYDDDDEEPEDEQDVAIKAFLGENELAEQAKERAEAKEALWLLLDQFSPEQRERYMVYRGAGLQTGSVRKLINHVLQQSCAPSVVTGFRGIAKVFIGEIVEGARQVQSQANQTGPVTPDHLREAYLRYKAVQNKRGSKRAKLFVR